jgi:hypothetical protein
MYKVRFHLAAGENFMKWQIKHPDGTVEFHDPNSVGIIMTGCFLRNQKGTAEKIFEGANKTVCAWVEAKEVTVLPFSEVTVDPENKIGYNPKVTPNWVYKGEDVDGESFTSMYSVGRTLYNKVRMFECIEHGERFVIEAKDMEDANDIAAMYGGSVIREII